MNRNMNFYKIDTNGNELIGIDGIKQFCLLNKLNYNVYIKEYTKKLNTLKELKNGYGFIEGNLNNFKIENINKLYFYDFVNYNHFGKINIAEKIYYGKLTGNEKLLNNVIKEINGLLNTFIKEKDYDAVGYIPHSVNRPFQLLDNLFKKVYKKKEIKFERYTKSGIIVPQKTIRNIENKKINAFNTFILKSNSADILKMKKILLIDDVINTGISLNMNAKKIKIINPNIQIEAFTICSS